MTKSFGTYEIARICDVSPSTVGQWIAAGKLACFKTGGGHRRVLDSELTAFLKSHNIPLPPALAVLGKTRILIVDDEPKARALMRGLLARALPEAELHEAEDGFEAGRKLGTVRPSVVILDLHLPGIDGLRVCRMIRADAETRHVRVLAVSGYSHEESRRAALGAGADDFLGKPFEGPALVERVGKLVSRG